MPMRIHFLNVGRGDCTLIEFASGRIGMVDIDNLRVLDRDTRVEVLQEYRASAAYQRGRLLGIPDRQLEEQFLKEQEATVTDPLAYYDTHIGKDKNIFRTIITHPDMDHMTGLYRLHHQDLSKTIVNFWHTGRHDFNLATSTDDDWKNSPYDKRDWETYKELRDGNEPRTLQKYAGDSGEYWNDDGIQIWAPTPELETLAVENKESNVLSYVLKITYKGVSVVLGGDATADDTWRTIYPKLDMTGISILKASHHGRKTGYYGPAVKEMAPWLTITSVGDVEYDATENYRRYSTYTVSLRKAGDICITIKDDGTWHYPNSIEQVWKPKKTE